MIDATAEDSKNEVERLREENLNLKIMLNRYLPPNTSTKKRRRVGGFSSIFKNSQDSSSGNQNAPLGIIYAVDNSRKGREFIKLVSNIQEHTFRKRYRFCGQDFNNMITINGEEFKRSTKIHKTYKTHIATKTKDSR